MFMGKAQIVEFALKNIPMVKYGYDEDRIRRWSLGRVINELRDSGLRQDFIVLMENLRDCRNYIAHQILADDAIMKNLAGSRAQRFE